MNATITKAETKVRRAMEALLDRHPYFTGIVAHWKVVEDNERTQTMATNGAELIWNRSFVDTLTHDECKWVVLHEAGHCFLGHHIRLQGADRKLANVAFDLALNDLIANTAPERMRKLACFPGVGRYVDMPKNQDAEFYFRALGGMQEEKQDEQVDQSDEGDQDQDQGEQIDEGGEEGEEGSESTEASEGESEEQGGEGNSAQGSARAQGKGDLNEVEPGEVGEVLEGETDETGEGEREWQQSVGDGINAARLAGNLPGWVEQLAGTLLAPKRTVNWKDELRRWMQDVSRSQLSYTRPNRRSAWRSDVIMPSRYSRDSGKGCVLVDTSGSMSEDDMNTALSEIEKILAAFADAEVTMLQCDTRLIDREQKFRKSDFPLRVPQSWMGRGGTDLNPALRQIAMRRAQWSWLVVITDGYWHMGGAVDTGLPTIYVITANGAACGGQPGRAKVVKIGQ